MIDVVDLRRRWRQAGSFLDERGRRLFAANEALAQGHGGVTATSIATGLARSTINRGIQELRSARNDLGSRLRRPGGGRKSAVTHQPGLPAALETLIEGAIRGDPTSPLRWVSRSQRHLVKALTAQGFQISQRVVGKLLRELNYSCQANRKTREGSNNPDRNAQFEHVNATVQAAIAAGEPAISVDTKKKELVGISRTTAVSCNPEPVRVHDFKIPELGKVAPYGVGWQPVSEGCRGIRRRAQGHQHHTRCIPWRMELHHRSQSAATVMRLFRLRALGFATNSKAHYE